MKVRALKVFSELRDLEIVDSDGELCGICDDVAFSGSPGRPLKIKALLVGAGAYGGRLPRWVGWLVVKIAGRDVVEVPWSAVAHVTAHITLNRGRRELGLGAPDDRLRPWLEKLPRAK